MTLELKIKKTLEKTFQPIYLEVENESPKHSVPKGSETHFRILVVSNLFEGLSRVERQRSINDLFISEFKSGLHALSQKALTVKEWESQQPDQEKFRMKSPDCHTKSKP